MKLHAGGNDEQLGYVASAHDVSVDATWAWAGGATEALFDSQLVNSRTKLGSDTNISTCILPCRQALNERDIVHSLLDVSPHVQFIKWRRKRFRGPLDPWIHCDIMRS